MEKRLKAYIQYLESVISGNNPDEMKTAYSDILTQIAFFQHERLIHLIVTVTFAILALMSLQFFILTGMFAVMMLFLLLMLLLVPYIRHYYILENGTQRLYELYDIIHKELELRK